MAKLKPLSDLSEDLTKGDLARLICLNFPDKIGYYQNISKDNTIIFSSTSRLIVGRGNGIFLLDLSSGQLSDEDGSYDCPFKNSNQPRVTHYEVLRRAKRD